MCGHHLTITRLSRLGIALFITLSITPFVLDAKTVGIASVEFRGKNLVTNVNYSIFATQVGESIYSYIYLQDGMKQEDRARILLYISDLQNGFDSIYKTNLECFMDPPDKDKNSKINILIQDFIEPGSEKPGYIGVIAFASRELQSESVQQMKPTEVIYINSRAIIEEYIRGSRDVFATLAHELQYLQQFSRPDDDIEDKWVNEGLSEYAKYKNGFWPSEIDRLQPFKHNPEDNSLTNFPEGIPATPKDKVKLNAAYGAAFLFMLYLFEQECPDKSNKCIKDIVTQGLMTQKRMNNYLDQTKFQKFYKLFKGWAIANYVDQHIEAASNRNDLKMYEYIDYYFRGNVHKLAPLCKLSSHTRMGVSVNPASTYYLEMPAHSEFVSNSPLTVTVQGIVPGEIEAWVVKRSLNGKIDVVEVPTTVDNFSFQDVRYITLIVVNFSTSKTGNVGYEVHVDTGACTAIPGKWNVTEKGTLTCSITAEGQTETFTDPINGEGTISITQQNCTFSYDPLNSGYPSGIRAARREGSISGNSLTVRGLAILPAPGATLSENQFEGTGELSGSTINLSGIGKFTAMAVGEGGIPVKISCTSNTTAQFTRALCSPDVVATSVSAASYSDSSLSPESIASVFGKGLAFVSQPAARTPLPTTLGGSSVLITDRSGTSRAAPLFYVSPGQINFQVPQGTATGMATLTITNGNATVASGSVQIAPVTVGLFTANQDGAGVPAGFAVRVKSGGLQSSESLYKLDTTTGKYLPAQIDLGAESEQVFLVLFGTGFRFRLSDGTVTCLIGGIEAEVLYAGPQNQYVGLDQCNIRIPRSLAGRGEVDVELKVDGKAANAVRIAIK